MIKVSKTVALRVASVLLMFVAATGVNTACWFFWYQPKMLKE
jgi:cyclic lactone autoinducer peptide